jgi:phosphatidylserine/phosphatidylglycerophosphate/cardiolipin synthase-like enzyme
LIFLQLRAELVRDCKLVEKNNMSSVTAKKGTFSLTAYRGDAKTLLAFNLSDKSSSKNLAGFTIQCQPKGQDAFYIQNQLRFENPGNHAQDPKEPATSSINAPIHKFRWLHIPGSIQGTKPFFGEYAYTVTPRYFENKSLQPLDPKLSASITVTVDGFEKKGLELGFTRGFTQSQAFVRHFGLKAHIKPPGGGLIFDTTAESGANAQGQKFTYQDEYEWLGFTARAKIFDLLNEVLQKPNLSVDVFAYDLNEPDVCNLMLKLGKQKRLRIILDNAALHHNVKKPKPEDQFEKLFDKAAGAGQIKRGKFGSFAHDKVFIVSNKSGPLKVLTGSTNFSVTGLYVNSNHVIVFNDPAVAKIYSDVFEESWKDDVKRPAYLKSKFSSETASFSSKLTPKTTITFSPHQTAFATTILSDVVKRIKQEGKKPKSEGSVLFAVMQINKGGGPVYPALNTLHKNQSIFSYGISDSPKGIALFPIGKKTGVLVTGKPVNTVLPPPFNQVPGVGLGHQVHHKFVVCGFNGDDPVVFCGSSNMALGGEEKNGDNLLAIYDGDVATAFAIEALSLVDHFDFLDRTAKGPKARKGKKTSPAMKQSAAAAAGWFLSTNDTWVAKYFDPKDLHSVDRQLFGS